MDCEEYTSESEDTDSSANVDVSRLITEEDLLDSVFYTCDVDNTGRIPVSRLIEYLKETTGRGEVRRYQRMTSDLEFCRPH